MKMVIFLSVSLVHQKWSSQTDEVDKSEKKWLVWFQSMCINLVILTLYNSLVDALMLQITELKIQIFLSFKFSIQAK